MRTTMLAAALVGGLALLSSGCGGDGSSLAGDNASAPASTPSSPSPSPSPTATSASSSPTAAASAEPTDEPTGAPVASSTAVDEQKPSEDASLSVTEVRIGHHDGYDRVVFELGGSGQPGWRTEYIAEPSSQGSGEAVDLPGSAALQVLIRGVGYPFDTGVDEYAGPKTITAAGTSNVTAVHVGGVFEGQYDAFIGVQKQTPYTVTRLSDPARIVVDIVTP